MLFPCPILLDFQWNKAKKNQPSTWAKTALGITENNGRRQKDKENISRIGETVGRLRKISGWTWQTLPKTVFCKVIAVLKNHQFICNIVSVFIYDFLCPVRRFSQAGPINDKSWTSTNALYTPTYWLLRLTISGKTNILRKTRWRKRHLHIYLLKETLPKLMISFFSSKTLWRWKYLSFLRCK